MKFSEKLLHFIWRYKLINQSNLCTTEGEMLRILDFGQYNTNAGPDFEFAKIQINNRIWIGNIELHLNSTDWNNHQHHLDSQYNTTILHVVWDNNLDSRVARADGTLVPTLVLKDCIDERLLDRYQVLLENQQWIPCENQLQKISELTISTWLDRLIVERLESKMLNIESWLVDTNYDWEKVQLVALARAFGMKVNAHAFENLVLHFDINLIHKNADNLFQIETLLFGCAGFLTTNTIADNYYADLKTEFTYLKKLYGLYSQFAIEWKFLRMRPYNFPSFRLAQFCGLLFKRIQWFQFSQSSSLTRLIQDLNAVSTSSYWKTHFHFSKITKSHRNSLTNAFIEHLILNAFVPVMFVYGRHTGNYDLQQKALDWLQQLKVESNSIITNYKNIGILAKNAGESQGLLHLYKHYCTTKKCLDCAIGYKVLNN